MPAPSNEQAFCSELPLSNAEILPGKSRRLLRLARRHCIENVPRGAAATFLTDSPLGAKGGQGTSGSTEFKRAHDGTAFCRERSLVRSSSDSNPIWGPLDERLLRSRKCPSHGVGTVAEADGWTCPVKSTGPSGSPTAILDAARLKAQCRLAIWIANQTSPLEHDHA